MTIPTSIILIVSIGQVRDPIKMIDIITKVLRETQISSHTSQSLKMTIGIKTFINTNEIEVAMC